MLAVGRRHQHPAGGHQDGAGVARYTVQKVADRYEIRDAHTEQLAQITFDREDAAEACARWANAIEEATVAGLENWLAA